MRQDMAKVIVERPRYGSSLPSRKKGYRKSVQAFAADELPLREPMLGRWHGRERVLNEHLGPMRRFLRSNVGRPWNKVHQDLCEHVSFDNSVQKHVLTHVFDFVERNVELRGGVAVHASGWRYGKPLSVGQMYVCPKSGLLRTVGRSKPESLPTRILSTVDQIHILCDGVWWELRLREIPEDPGDLWDVWLERPVARLTVADSVAAYGGKRFAMSKRPLTREDTRQLLRRRRRLRHSRFRTRTNRKAFCPET